MSCTLVFALIRVRKHWWDDITPVSYTHLSSLCISETICIFHYFCPYEIIVRKIRESFIQSLPANLSSNLADSRLAFLVECAQTLMVVLTSECPNSSCTSFVSAPFARRLLVQVLSLIHIQMCIRDRRYDEALRDEGRCDILAYGIAFCRKRCRVVGEKIND